MTYGKLMRLYKHYKNNYDFTIARVPYSKLDDEAAHDGEFIRD